MLLGAAVVAALWSPLSAMLQHVPVRDFASYWAAAVLLTQNPYDVQAVYEMETAAGAGAREPLIMRNPPWTLPLIAPLGLLPLQHARTLWFLISILGMWWPAKEIWKQYGERRGRLTAAMVVTFVPATVLLLLGQITWVMLVGLAMFLSRLRSGRLFSAGAALALLTVKPHLVVPVLLALMIWSAHTREWRPMAGMAAALAALSGVVVILNPQVFSQYVQYLASENLMSGTIQTLGGHLMRQTGWDWVRWAPLAVAVVWTIGFYIGRGKTWAWKEALPALVVAGVVAAPYGFTFDQVILLAALIPAAGVANPTFFVPALVLVNAALVAPIFAGGEPDPRWASTTAAAWAVIFAHGSTRSFLSARAGHAAG